MEQFTPEQEERIANAPIPDGSGVPPVDNIHLVRHLWGIFLEENKREFANYMERRAAKLAFFAGMSARFAVTSQ